MKGASKQIKSMSRAIRSRRKGKDVYGWMIYYADGTAEAKNTRELNASDKRFLAEGIIADEFPFQTMVTIRNQQEYQSEQVEALSKKYGYGVRYGEFVDDYTGKPYHVAEINDPHGTVYTVYSPDITTVTDNLWRYLKSNPNIHRRKKNDE